MRFAKKESDIATEIVKVINTKRGDVAFAYKTPVSPFGRAGTPDVHVCVRGEYLAIEVKRPDRVFNLTAAQTTFRKRIWGTGGRYVVLTGPESALALIDGITQCRTDPGRSEGARKE